ncbi:MAG TPA: HNH endonuclease [Actinomycetes bacterium]|nr:HNH endonuclease [Actinomycetes bacterium]
MDEKVVARFWAKVNKDGPVPAHMPHLGRCWVWTAAQNGHGYGQLTVKLIRKSPIKAHHMVLLLERGMDIGGLYALHHCDNRLCVNPDHIFLGTHQDNMDDMVSKGRDRKALGELSSNAKLTAEDVAEIRRGRSSGETVVSLARRFSVSEVAIRDIIFRRTWRHVD